MKPSLPRLAPVLVGLAFAPPCAGALHAETATLSPHDQIKAQSRAFSPQAIADLLKKDAARAVPVPDGGAAAALAPARAPLSPEAVNATRFARVSPASRNVDPVVLKAEILLDRAHAPPGVIDGRFGANFTKAITTFQTVRGLPVDGRLTLQVWDELGGDTAAPVLGTYAITAQDVVGPFYPDLSPDYAEQAKMPDLGYRSAEDMFGERFHMDHKFLRALNPGVDMGVAGNTIVVAEVAAMPIAVPDRPD